MTSPKDEPSKDWSFYKDIAEMISKKCHDLHHHCDDDLCVNCQDDLLRLCQDIIEEEGIELKDYGIGSPPSEMGTVRIDRDTMDAFDLNPHNIVEIRTRSGGHSVASILPLPPADEGKGIIHVFYDAS